MISQSEKTNPIQSQFPKGQNERNFYLTKDYENKPPLPALGKQTQSNPIKANPPTPVFTPKTNVAPKNNPKRGRWKSPTATPEIAVRFFESLAMTRKWTFCHCEELSDEAISRFSTAPKNPIFSLNHDNFSPDFVNSYFVAANCRECIRF